MSTAEQVYAQLEEDFPQKALLWVSRVPWSGPERVPLDHVDFSAASTWRAYHEPERVSGFMRRIAVGRSKPVLLVKSPANPKYVVIDGHHRALACLRLGRPIDAFCAEVPSAEGPWTEMHSSQRTGPSLMGDRSMDLGTGSPFDPRMPWQPPAEIVQTMTEMIGAGKRKALPQSQFADPVNRKYPIDTAARTRNAAARLEQQKASLSTEEYRAIRGRIARAARKFGIDSAYNKPASRNASRFHVRADLAHGGSLHISHHMSDRSLWIEGHAITLGEDVDPASVGVELKASEGENEGEKRLVWIQVAESGHFRGHPAGPFTMDDGTFTEIVRNFQRDKLPVPIDYEHASEADPTSGTIPSGGAPATGWIHQLEHRPGKGLWGLVEWLPRARDQIKAGEYRYLSPAVRFGSKDRVTGEPTGAKLTSAALTNQPFLKNMEPLMAAKDTKQFAYSANEFMPRLRQALRMGELATAEETRTQVGRLRKHFEASGYSVDGMSDGVKLADFMHPLRDMTGLGMASTWEQMFDAVEDLIDYAIDKHEITQHGGAMPEMDDAGEETMTAKDLTDMSTEEKQQVVVMGRENAELRLQLKDAQSKATSAEEQLRGMAAKFAEHEKRVLTERVDRAFNQWQTTRNLTDTDREAMILVASSNPELFDKLYPSPINPAPVHMTQRLTGGAATKPSLSQASEEDEAARVHGESYSETTKRLMKEQGLSYDIASSKAFQLRRSLKAIA